MTRTRLLIITAVLAVIGVGLDVAMGADPPGYALTVGLGGCIAIILVSKWIGKAWLQRPDPDAVPEEPPVPVPEREGDGDA